MRLRHIATVDFRKSEYTNYRDLIRKHKGLARLRKDDVILMRSSSGLQLVFIHGFAEVDSGNGTPRSYLRSERLRLLESTPWQPWMLADYALSVGIKLDGIKTFEQHLIKLDKLASNLKDMWAAMDRQAA